MSDRIAARPQITIDAIFGYDAGTATAYRMARYIVGRDLTPDADPRAVIDNMRHAMTDTNPLVAAMAGMRGAAAIVRMLADEPAFATLTATEALRIAARAIDMAAAKQEERLGRS